MFNYTEDEKVKCLEAYFLSVNPLRLRLFPPKQKKKYIVLNIIIKLLDEQAVYTEKKLNEILREVYADYASIRRGFIEFGLLAREKDGSKYWINKKD